MDVAPHRRVMQPGGFRTHLEASMHWRSGLGSVLEPDSGGLCPESGVLGLDGQWLAGEQFLAALERFLLEPSDRFMGVEGEVG